MTKTWAMENAAKTPTSVSFLCPAFPCHHVFPSWSHCSAAVCSPCCNSKNNPMETQRKPRRLSLSAKRILGIKSRRKGQWRQKPTWHVDNLHPPDFLEGERNRGFSIKFPDWRQWRKNGQQRGWEMTENPVEKHPVLEPSMIQSIQGLGIRRKETMAQTKTQPSACAECLKNSVRTISHGPSSDPTPPTEKQQQRSDSGLCC